MLLAYGELDYRAIFHRHVYSNGSQRGACRHHGFLGAHQGPTQPGWQKPSEGQLLAVEAFRSSSLFQAPFCLKSPSTPSAGPLSPLAQQAKPVEGWGSAAAFASSQRNMG